MKVISFITKTMNFSAKGRNNRAGLEGSLNHDLRLGETTNKKLNHDTDHNNKVWVYQKDGSLAATYTTKDVQKCQKVYEYIHNRTAPMVVSEKGKECRAEVTKIQNRISAVRNKFKTYKGNDSEIELFRDMTRLDITLDEMIANRAKYEQLDGCKRHKQKLKQFDTFISHHQELEQAKPASVDERKLNLATTCQSLFLKIPNANGIAHDQVSIDDYNRFITKFWAENFPNHPILATIGHTDERSVVEGLEGTGDHLHIYVDGKNKSTRKCDLLETQTKWACAYVAKHNPQLFEIEKRAFIKSKTDLRQIHNVSTREERLRQVEGGFRGRIWQEALRLNVNKYLFLEKNLKVEYKYTTREAPELVADANKPQRSRKNSRMQQREEEIQKLDHSISTLKNQESQIQNRIASKSKIESEVLDLEQQKTSLIASIKPLQAFKAETEAWIVMMAEKLANRVSEALNDYLVIDPPAMTAYRLADARDDHVNAIKAKQDQAPNEFSPVFGAAFADQADSLILEAIKKKADSKQGHTVEKEYKKERSKRSGFRM